MNARVHPAACRALQAPLQASGLHPWLRRPVRSNLTDDPEGRPGTASRSGGHTSPILPPTAKDRGRFTPPAP